MACIVVTEFGVFRNNNEQNGMWDESTLKHTVDTTNDLGFSALALFPTRSSPIRTRSYV